MEIEVKDSNGSILNDGDTIILTRSLKVKGLPKPLKKGAKAKNIRLTDNSDEIDCRIDKVSLVVKTCYVKKA